MIITIDKVQLCKTESRFIYDDLFPKSNLPATNISKMFFKNTARQL